MAVSSLMKRMPKTCVAVHVVGSEKVCFVFAIRNSCSNSPHNSSKTSTHTHTHSTHARIAHRHTDTHIAHTHSTHAHAQHTKVWHQSCQVLRREWNLVLRHHRRGGPTALLFGKVRRLWWFRAVTLPSAVVLFPLFSPHG